MKTDISIWEEETFFSDQQIVIIGGGFLGLWSALELKLKDPKAAITILERGIIPMGASTRNAGFACFGSPTEMLLDSKLMGDDKMWQTVEMRYKGISKIRRLFNDDVIAYDACGGYECFDADTNILDELKSKLSWLNKGMFNITGNENSFQWCNNKLKDFEFNGFHALIENQLEGGLHSGKLLRALIQKVQSLGVHIFNGITVNGWNKIAGKIVISTSIATIKTEQLLICTNGFASQLLPEVFIEPARGQVFVTAPIEGLKMKGTFHYNEGYYYFRNVGNRVLIGGARNLDFATENTDELLLNEKIQIELKRFVSTHLLPSTPFNITHQWSGIMGFTKDKLPVVQAVEENIYVAVACNGMGVALSPIIAEQVAALMS